jgi:hypothetical protein
LAAATGATTKELMRRLGHASPQAALTYQHATEDGDQAIAEALAKLSQKASVTTVVPGGIWVDSEGSELEAQKGAEAS